MTNESGQGVWQWSYSAFGDEKPTVAKYRFANLDINPNPGTTSIAEVTNNLRYPGQYADKESGLHYNYFRSYDSRTGRYSQPDPIGLDGGWNQFVYASGNPLIRLDPLGLFGIGDVIPDDAPIWAMGRAYGGLAAYIVGKASGDESLAEEAMNGLQCSRDQSIEALGVLATGGRGGRSQLFKLYPSRKAAKDAAAASPYGPFLKEGKTQGPEQHAPNQLPHYHDGAHGDPSKSNTHYQFPKKQF